MKQINVTESKMSEAMTQIEGLDGLSPKEKGCLRLLTEEMFSMKAVPQNSGYPAVLRHFF